jgi:hypothetical protein
VTLARLWPHSIFSRFCLASTDTIIAFKVFFCSFLYYLILMYSFPFPAIFPLYFPLYQKVAATFVNRLISTLTFTIVKVVILHNWCWFRTLHVLAFEAGRKHSIGVNTISAGENAQLRNNFFECLCFVSSIGGILHWFSYINRSEMSTICSAIWNETLFLPSMFNTPNKSFHLCFCS